MRCVAGIAKCVTNSGDGCDANNNDAPSAGYQVLSVTDMGTLKTGTCGLAALSLSYGDHPLFGQCSLSGPGITYLSVYVDQYCGGERHTRSHAAACCGAAAAVLHTGWLPWRCAHCMPPSRPVPLPAAQITPMKDQACSEPGAAYWDNMDIRAHYVKPDLISTRIDGTAARYTAAPGPQLSSR